MTAALLALRFAIEIALLVAFVLWGLRTADGLAGWVLGLAAAAAVAVLWGTFVAPKARIRKPLSFRLVIESMIVLAAGAALWSVDLRAFAVVLVLAASLTVTALIVRGRPPGT